MFLRLARVALPVALPVVLAALPLAARAGDLAVIVHPDNQVQSLSAGELREILLLERQHWRGAGRVYLLLPETGTAEKDLLLQRALRMTEDQLHRYYLGRLYAGEIPEFPQVVPTGAAARRIVARAQNAVAIVDVAAVDGSVKVLRIDGRAPGEAGYPLAGRKTGGP